MATKLALLITWVVLLVAPQQLTAQVNQKPASNNPSEASKTPSPSLNERQAEINNAAQAESDRYRKDRDAKEDAFKAEQLRQNRIIVNATIWIAIATCLNFLVAIIYAIFAGRQLSAMERANRPVVVVHTAETIPNLAPNVPLRPRVSYTNTGRTPACEMDITAEFAKPGVVYMAFPKVTSPRGLHNIFLAADQSGAIEGAPADAITLDSEMYESIMGGKHWLLIYGTGSYKNLAGKTVRPSIKFCFRYSREHKRFIPHDI